MDWTDILNDLINELHPEQIPMEYLIAATYLDRHGLEHMVRGAELARFIAHPEQFQPRQAQVILDAGKIRQMMHDTINVFFRQLNEHIARNRSV